MPLFARFHGEALAAVPQLEGRRLLYDSLRRMLSEQVYDLIASATETLHAYEPQSADAVRSHMPLIHAGAGMSAGSAELKAFLRTRLYRHPRVVATTEAAKGVVRELFEAYTAEPAQMPARHAARQPVQQAIADYIAGMTDRFALREHVRLHGPGCSRFPDLV